MTVTHKFMIFLEISMREEVKTRKSHLNNFGLNILLPSEFKKTTPFFDSSYFSFYSS